MSDLTSSAKQCIVKALGGGAESCLFSFALGPVLGWMD